MIQLLLIEDDLSMQELLITYLKGFDINAHALVSPTQALSLLRQKNPSFDIIILDLMLPEMDGLDLCKQIRTLCQTPIIISSARGDLGNKILGFELGVDDYLSKPYEPRELILRINAVLKRHQQKIIEINNLRIDILKQEVFLNDIHIELTPTEMNLLMLFISKRGEAISRETLSYAIEHIHENSYLRSIDTHISNLRSKLGDDVKNPKYIKSVWGIGYKFIA